MKALPAKIPNYFASKRTFLNELWLDTDYLEGTATPGYTNHDLDGVEYQIGIDITKKLNFNLRFFDYDHSQRSDPNDGRDYQKWEGRIVYKF